MEQDTVIAPSQLDTTDALVKPRISHEKPASRPQSVSSEDHWQHITDHDANFQMPNKNNNNTTTNISNIENDLNFEEDDDKPSPHAVDQTQLEEIAAVPGMRRDRTDTTSSIDFVVPLDDDDQLPTTLTNNNNNISNNNNNNNMDDNNTANLNNDNHDINNLETMSGRFGSTSSIDLGADNANKCADTQAAVSASHPPLPSIPSLKGVLAGVEHAKCVRVEGKPEGTYRELRRSVSMGTAKAIQSLQHGIDAHHVVLDVTHKASVAADAVGWHLTRTQHGLVESYNTSILREKLESVERVASVYAVSASQSLQQSVNQSGIAERVCEIGRKFETFLSQTIKLFASRAKNVREMASAAAVAYSPTEVEIAVQLPEGAAAEDAMCVCVDELGLRAEFTVPPEASQGQTIVVLV